MSEPLCMSSCEVPSHREPQSVLNNDYNQIEANDFLDAHKPDNKTLGSKLIASNHCLQFIIVMPQ